MRKIKKLLPDKYYLDRNFMPLAERIVNKLKLSPFYHEVKPSVIEDIVSDTLSAIKPRAKSDSNGRTILY